MFDVRYWMFDVPFSLPFTLSLHCLIVRQVSVWVATHSQSLALRLGIGR